MAQRVKLRKREIGVALGIGALAATALAGILSDGFGGPGSSFEDEEETIASETYQLSDFAGVSSIGPQEVLVTLGDEFAVRSEGAPEALALLEAVVEDGRLVIRPREGMQGDFDGDELSEARFFVTLPELDSLALTGSGNLLADRIETDAFTANVVGSGWIEIKSLTADTTTFSMEGSGDLDVSGTARETTVTLNGSGNVAAGALRSRVASVTLTGSGDAELAATERADVRMTGSGDVEIIGTEQCTVVQMGSGEVTCGPDGD